MMLRSRAQLDAQIKECQSRDVCSEDEPFFRGVGNGRESQEWCPICLRWKWRDKLCRVACNILGSRKGE
jgi:hypothetical protein